MSLPREPRQKMINMMYLVLTALLALNVSAEILNAFKTVNRSLETTNATVDKSSTTIMASLDQKLLDAATREKALIWQPKALQAQGFAKTAYSYIQTLKDEILTKSGGDPKDPTKKYKEDNLDIPTRMMVDKGGGKKLYATLDQFKKDILSIDPEIAKEFANTLPIDLSNPKGEDKKTKNWEYAYFHMVPSVAALTILSKFQNDIKTSENKVIAFCHNKVGEVIVRYDRFAALAQTNKSYVMPGDEMEITAGVGAFSKAALPTINIAGQVVPLDPDGVSRKKMNAETSLGEHSINVTVEFTDQDGKKQTISTPIKYTVGQSTASIALDKMNVLYIGVDNPVTIAASGAGDDKIGFSITGGGGTYTKAGGGKYVVRVNSVTDECWINVSVDGKVAGKSKFRVRTIPKPIAIIGPYESGSNVPAGAFKAQSGVGAFVKDFPFELQYKVTKFTISADTDDGYIDDATVTGNSWSADANANRIVNSLKSGRTVMIDEIYATGPDGRSQHLPSLVYYIK